MNGRTNETLLMGNPTQPKYILCKYSETENGEVKLIRVEEFSSEGAAGKKAFELLRENARCVILTELVSAYG